MIQNIDFCDVAIDVADEINENENLKIVFDELIDDLSVNARSFRDENVANDVNTAFDVDVLNTRCAIIHEQINEYSQYF